MLHAVNSRNAGGADDHAATYLASRFGDIGSLEGRIDEIVQAVPGTIAFSTSFGLEDQAILHAVAQAGAGIDTFTLDTGRHFPETLETLERSEQRYNVRIRVLSPAAEDLEQVVARDGVFGFRVSVDARKACCEVRKVRPLKRGLVDAAAWITGLRRGQASGRATVPFAEWDNEHALIKINPIADWTAEQLDAYIAAHDIPVNPLHARGLPSIGCQPCTRAIRPGEDIRAGRWWWENADGKECGLHNRPPAVTGASA